jgi:uncharacterized protein YegL
MLDQLLFISSLFSYPILALLGGVIFFFIPFIHFFMSADWNIKAIRALLILISFVFVLAAVPRFHKESIPSIYTLILVDTSNSIDEKNLKKAQAEIQTLFDKYQEYYKDYNAYIAIMNFAGEYRIIHPWKALQDITASLDFTLQRDKNPEITDLSQALEVGARLLRTQAKYHDKKQLILLTDGNDSYHKKELPAVISTALTDIDLDIRIIASGDYDKKQVWIDDIAMPRTIRLGEPFDIVFIAKTNQKEAGKLWGRVKIKGEGIEYEFNSELKPYPFNTTVTLPSFSIGIIKKVGYYRYDIELFNPEKPDEILDKKTRVVKIFKPVEILIIEARKNLSEDVRDFIPKLLHPVKAQIKIASILSEDFENVMTNQLIANILKPNDLIIFYDIPGKFFKESHIEILERYVRSEAGGLLFIGGSSSFEYGGYETNNKLMKLLPVKIDKPVTYLRSGLFVFVLDVSGSMDGSPLEALKQSVLNTLESIPADGNNQVAIYIFDTNPKELIDKVLRSEDDKESLKLKVQDLSADGGTKLLPALKDAIIKAEAFLQAKTPNIGAKIYIYSDDNLEDTPEEIQNVLTNIDPRIQLSTLTIDNSPTTMALVSQLGGGHALSMSSNEDQFIHFDPDVDPNLPSMFNLYCRSSDPILGELFADHCPGVYGFNNLIAKKHTITSLVLKDHKANLLTLKYLGRGKVTTVGMDLHGVWSKQFFSTKTISTFVGQLVYNTGRNIKENKEKYSHLMLKRTPKGVKARLYLPLTKTGPFTIYIDDKKDKKYPMILKEPGIFEAILPSVEDDRDSLKVTVENVQDSYVKGDEIWIENSIVRPEQFMLVNIELLYQLHNRTLTKAIGEIQSQKVFVTKALLEKLLQTELDGTIKKYIQSQAGRTFKNSKNLINDLYETITYMDKSREMLEEEKKEIKQLIDEAKNTPFQKPEVNNVRYVPFYDILWLRIPLLLTFILLLFYTVAARLGKRRGLKTFLPGRKQKQA